MKPIDLWSGLGTVPSILTNLHSFSLHHILVSSLPKYRACHGIVSVLRSSNTHSLSLTASCPLASPAPPAPADSAPCRRPAARVAAALAPAASRPEARHPSPSSHQSHPLPAPPLSLRLSLHLSLHLALHLAPPPRLAPPRPASCPPPAAHHGSREALSSPPSPGADTADSPTRTPRCIHLRRPQAPPSRTAGPTTPAPLEARSNRARTGTPSMPSYAGLLMNRVKRENKGRE